MFRAPFMLKGLRMLPKCRNSGRLLASDSPHNIAKSAISWFLITDCQFRNFHTSVFRLDKGPSLSSSILEQIKEKDQKEEKPEEDDSAKGPKPMGKWTKIGYQVFAVLMIGGTIGNAILFSLPDQDENGKVIEDEYSSLPAPKQHYARLKNRVFRTKKEIEEPFSDKLLPDPLPAPYIQPKYTILVELTGLLVHATWSHKHGWRFQKRPGVDMLLSQIGYPNFELVVFTVENAPTFYPIVDGLDPNQNFIIYRLFRDGTRYLNGSHVKDLSALNRDPKRVIVIDWNRDSVQLQPDNGLILQKWTGDNSDRNLIGLAQLLQAIKQSDVDDVREVLSYYKQFDDPISAFRENQRKLETEMAALEEKKMEEKQAKKSSHVSSFLGFRRSPSS